MTWTRLSDTFADRPDIMGLSDAAFRAHIEALVWSNKQLTDGRIPTTGLRRILSGDPEAVLAELEAAALWESDGADVLVDWSDQEMSDRVEERRAENRRRDERRRHHNKGDHSLCDPKRCHYLLAHPDALTREQQRESHSEPRPPVPSRPVPTPREGEGRGDAGARSAGATRSPRPEEVDEVLAGLRGAAEKGDMRAAELLRAREEHGHMFMPDDSGLSCKGMWDDEGEFFSGCGLPVMHVIHYGFENTECANCEGPLDGYDSDYCEACFVKYFGNGRAS